MINKYICRSKIFSSRPIINDCFVVVTYLYDLKSFWLRLCFLAPAQKQPKVGKVQHGKEILNSFSCSNAY